MLADTEHLQYRSNSCRADTRQHWRQQAKQTPSLQTKLRDFL